MAKRRPKTAAGTKAEVLDWVRNPADEAAAAAGLRFDPERANFVCGWIEEHCCLYEGDKAGEPLVLLPYQRDFVARLFGWVRWSDEWGGWVRRFTKAALWAAKKNGKSPFLAALGLYLLCGDGEPGQKVYTAAKNGEQAKIAQRHAYTMVEQSPALAADCHLNGSTLQVAHRPTRSMMLILTGDDSRAAKAREGLNGSVLIDECHVFDREMHERTSRAGISRREPVNLSVSTAGDDPSSYGFERCRYGRQVNAGERADPHFLHVEYGALDGVKESEIDARLDELGKAANPAWGSIVKPSEFRADWQASRGNQRETARFKQYRINLWVGSTNAWLDAAAWERCGEDYALADLAGRDCYLAMDLSRTRDMTAAVFAFPFPEEGPEVVKFWPLFWLPEQTARERNHLFPFLTWGRAGGPLALTAGGVVDYARVKADLRAAVTGHRLNVLALYYDEHYAEELTQQLHEGERLGDATAPGVVAERVAYRQNLMGYTKDAKEFERRTQAGLLRHPRNPVLTWQVGHVEVYADTNQNIRPVKPAPHSGKSVDGVQCAVMTMTGVTAPVPDRTAPSRLLVL